MQSSSNENGLEIVVCKNNASHGHPVLFVHGMCCGAWIWKEVQSILAPYGIESHALSLRGHGKSSAPRALKWTSLDDYLQDIRRAIETIGRKVVLVGHSMGGWLVQHYAAKYPEDVEGVIIMCSTTASGVWGTARRMLLEHPMTFFSINTLYRVRECFGTKSLFAKFFFSRTFEDWMTDFWNKLCEESYWIFSQMMFLYPKPSSILVPVCVVGADHDTTYTVREVKNLAIAFGVPLVLLGGPHALMLTDAGQVARVIVEFVKRLRYR